MPHEFTPRIRIVINLPSHSASRARLEKSLANYSGYARNETQVEVEVPAATARHLIKFHGARAVPRKLEIGDDDDDGVWDPPSHAGFQSYDSLRRELIRLASTSKGDVLYESLGVTCEGREIPAVRILPEGEVSKRILLVGGHHARERISVEIPYRLGWYVFQARLQGQPLACLSTTELVIVPLLNPDGYAYLSPADYNWNWRKNRSPQGSAVGVDLNRNYPWAWGTGQGSSDPESIFYRGRNCLSEKETQAIADLFCRIKIDALISYHSYGQAILYPWASEDYLGGDARIDRLICVAEQMAMASMAVGAAYKTLPASRLYSQPVGGELGDWAIRKHGIDALAVELPPVGEPGFKLRASEIQAAFDGHLPAAVRFFEWVESL